MLSLICKCRILTPFWLLQGINGLEFGNDGEVSLFFLGHDAFEIEIHAN